MTRALLGAVLVVAAVAPAGAASFTLSPAQQRAALAAGAASVTDEEFGREWRAGGADGALVTVLTPFHRLALAARHAAFRGEPLEPRESEKLLKAQAGRLVLLVELRGPRADFARHLRPVLEVGDRRIQPAFVQNERTPARQPDGRYLARSTYRVPVDDLDPGARVTLVVAGADGRDVSRIPIDLAAMR